MSPAPAIIGLTGHRPGLLSRAAPHIIQSTIERLVRAHPGATWRAGGAVGADTIATTVLLWLKQPVELILPFPPEIHSERWNRTQRRVLEGHIRRASRVRVLFPRYDVRAYHQRNRSLLVDADLLVAFYNGFEFTGTGQTVREAERRRIPVMTVAV